MFPFFDICYKDIFNVNFFKENNIHPAEFLRAAWAYEDETSKLIDWVSARKSRN